MQDLEHTVKVAYADNSATYLGLETLWSTWDGGPFHEQFSTQNQNRIEITFCCDLICRTEITTNFCTCHDSNAVMTCAKVCSDQ